MTDPKWHHSPTRAGKPGSAGLSYDIGASDNENIALVHPAEDGDAVTLERAKLFVEARETARQRDMLLEAAKAAVVMMRRYRWDSPGAETNAPLARLEAAIEREKPDA